MIPLVALLQGKAAAGIMGALTLALAVSFGAYRVTTWRLAAERAAHAETREQVGSLKTTLEQAKAANADLTRRVQAQNQAIAALETKGREREARAATAVRKVLEKPAPLPEGSGPEVLNAFMRSMGVRG